jgi:hypothetical protein
VIFCFFCFLNLFWLLLYYLGFLIDTATMSVEVPGPKLDRISELLKKFLLSNSHKAREITSVLGKLNALEPALGKAVFVGTLLATMAVIVATEVSEAEIRWKSPWGGEKVLILDADAISSLCEVGQQLRTRNGHPIRAWHKGISLSSILPLEATVFSFDMSFMAFH